MPGQFMGRGMGGLMSSGAAVAAGWWVVAGKTCVAAYKPKGAASLAASYVNLANPGTYDAAPGTAPTLDANGWIFNGSSQYLTTGIVPVNDQTWSMIIRFSDASTAASYCMAGLYDADNATFSLFSAASGTSVVYRSGGALTIATAMSSGVLAVAGAKGYRNGTIEAGSVGAPSGNITSALQIGRVSGYAQWFPGKIQAMAVYSDTLTAGEVAALSTKMAAL